MTPASPPLPLTRDLVLVGGGHSHALVLRMWGMQPLAGVRLTLINPGPTAPYSGMLPGFVAGHYSRSDLEIDLVKLARFAGARLILGAATALDPVAKQITVPGRPPVAYDVASIDIGITSDLPNLPGFGAYGVPAKPLGTFATRWATFRDQSTDPAPIAVIGGGIAGAELILAMTEALRSRGRLAEATLIDHGQALAAVSPKSRARIHAALRASGVTVLEQAAVAEIAADHLLLRDGRRVSSGFTVGAAGARPYDWIQTAGLVMHDGAISVGETLQSSDPDVFASGDCAYMRHAPRPKAGVFAVRQAPVLLHNLRVALSTDTAQPGAAAIDRMRRYWPQKDYLKLVSLGGKTALADRNRFTIAAPLLWRWKDHIDQTFMAKFRQLPTMEPSALPDQQAAGMKQALGDKPLCGGCGAKVGRETLRAGLSEMGHSLGGARRSDVTPLPFDDAAQLQIGGATQVISTDHLRAFVSDPVTMTQITAQHALNDIWAMGAGPQAATLSLILPRQSPALQQRQLAEIMQTASAVMREAGAAIVGGHTSLGDELTIGFTLTGLCTAPPLSLAGARTNDALIMTKPLGSGTLLAAEMAGLAEGAWMAEAYTLMCQSQSTAAEILRQAAPHAMTDVTGFGALGHLQGMCEASGVGAELRVSKIPMMRGAVEMAEAGLHSSLYAENVALTPRLAPPDGTNGARMLLHDPQTSGGLLAAVAPDKAQSVVSSLRHHGYAAACIGHITDLAGAITLVDNH